MNGRLRAALALFLALACIPAIPSRVSGEPFAGSAPEWAALRRRAVQRTRRVIMNHDGNVYDKSPARAVEERNAEHFLRPRVTALVEPERSQVDALFYCTGVFNSYSHYSRESELRRQDEYNWAWELAAPERDGLSIMVDFCRENGIEIFWSARMNDTHDVSARSLDELNPWKRDHPECLMGGPEDRRTFPHGGRRWSSLDYGCDKVRAKMLAILRDVASRYDIDGLELDFFRHPVYFRPQMTGAPVTDRHRAMMNGFLRQVFEMTEQVGRRRGRPLLIAVRVPDSIGFAREIGLDWEAWMRDGLVDLVVVSGYFRIEPWERSVALARRYGVPLYAGLSESRLRVAGESTVGTGQGVKGRERQTIECYRARALNAWKAGVNGIYTFNFFNPRRQEYHEIGDPTLLETVDKVFTTGARGVSSGLGNPAHWLKDGDRFINRPHPLPERPRDLLAGFPTAVFLPVGEAMTPGQRWELWAEVETLRDVSTLSALANGQALPEGRRKGKWILFEVDQDFLAEGSNRFELTLTEDRDERHRLTDLVLWVFHDRSDTLPEGAGTLHVELGRDGAVVEGDTTVSGRVVVTVAVEEFLPERVEFFIDGRQVWTESHPPFYLFGDFNTWDTTTRENGPCALRILAVGSGREIEFRLPLDVRN